MTASLVNDLRVIFRRLEGEGRSAEAVVIRDAIHELTAAPRSSTPEVLLSAGWLDVGHERKRQVEVEGWSAEHDDLGHDRGELAAAAASYAIATTEDWRVFEASSGNASFAAPPSCWPWGADWWKPKDRRHDLVRAGALIVAEIDRLDRKAGADLAAVNGRLA